MEESKMYMPNHWEEDENEDNLDSKAANNDIESPPPQQRKKKIDCCGDSANEHSHSHDHHHDHEHGPNCSHDHHHHHQQRTPADPSLFIPKPVQAQDIGARAETFFAKAWEAANGETMYGSRQVILITPTRTAFPIACPPPGFASKEMVRQSFPPLPCGHYLIYFIRLKKSKN